MWKKKTLKRILINSELPWQAKEALERWGTLIPFRAADLPHQALRGHVDLFLSQLPTAIFVLAANAPEALTNAVGDAGVTFLMGKTAVAASKASLGAYNVAVGGRLAIGNEHFCDPVLRQALREEGFHFVHVKQGLARCSALTLPDDAVVTSDGGIYKTLIRQGIEALLISAKEILLPGYAEGCFGGCCGVCHSEKIGQAVKGDGRDTVFLMGSLQHHPQGELVRNFLHEHNTNVVELFDGFLTDVGSFYFL